MGLGTLRFYEVGLEILVTPSDVSKLFPSIVVPWSTYISVNTLWVGGLPQSEKQTSSVKSAVDAAGTAKSLASDHK